MIRLLGILIGSAIAVAVLIVVVGIPEFPDDPRASSELTAAPATALEPVDDEVPEQVDARVTESLVTPEQESAESAESAGSVARDAAEIDTASEVGSAAQSDVEILDRVDNDPATVASTQWYAFWSPFRSEFAANGFVNQLQRTTGLDYRVVKQKPGVYEVAFAYTDDSDVEQKLAQISAATGLDLPES